MVQKILRLQDAQEMAGAKPLVQAMGFRYPVGSNFRLVRLPERNHLGRILETKIQEDLLGDGR